MGEYLLKSLLKDVAVHIQSLQGSDRWLRSSSIANAALKGKAMQVHQSRWNKPSDL